MDRQPNAYYNIPYVNIKNYMFDGNIKVLSKRFCKINKVVPMELHGNILTVCMGKPCEKLLKRIQKLTGKFITVFKSCPDKIDETINKQYV